MNSDGSPIRAFLKRIREERDQQFFAEQEAYNQKMTNAQRLVESCKPAQSPEQFAASAEAEEHRERMNPLNPERDL